MKDAMPAEIGNTYGGIDTPGGNGGGATDLVNILTPSSLSTSVTRLATLSTSLPAKSRPPGSILAL